MRTFDSPEEFQEAAMYVINKALALLKKNKGIDIKLNLKYSSVTIQSAHRPLTYIFNYKLDGPNKEANDHSLRSSFFDGQRSPTELPLIDKAMAASLENVRVQCPSISGEDFIALCVATWLFNLGKTYKYF